MMLAMPTSTFPPNPSSSILSFQSINLNDIIYQQHLTSKNSRMNLNFRCQGSTSTSTEALVGINTLAAFFDAIEMARLIRIPQARSFLDESSSDDISEHLLRTFIQDVQPIDEILEALLENIFSKSRKEGTPYWLI